MEAILPLSTTGRLPVPADKPFIPSVPRSDTAAEEEPTSPSLAPYQARPVTGSTIISHNYTPALPVLDADKLDQEVRACTPAPLPLLAMWEASATRCLQVPIPPLRCRRLFRRLRVAVLPHLKTAAWKRVFIKQGPLSVRCRKNVWVVCTRGVAALLPHWPPRSRLQRHGRVTRLLASGPATYRSWRPASTR